MVNKDQLDQTSEGQQVLALMAKHFTAEQFQPALTLIEQRYTDDQTAWDAELNHESKWPFLKTDSAHRLLIFFGSPNHVDKIKAELKQHVAEVVAHAAESQAGQVAAMAKPKAKRKTQPKIRGRKRSPAKLVKRKPRKSPTKRSKRKSRPAKGKKSRTKKR
jgi:hypothetical protein